MEYYKNLLANIEQLIEQSNTSGALKIINDELKMPYIPRDIEQQLLLYKKELENVQSDTSRTFDDETLCNYLKGDYNHQLLAVDSLDKRNLREYTSLCNEYLVSKGFINAKMLLIDSLISQEINHVFSCAKGDTVLQFNPSKLRRFYDTDSFKKGIQELETVFMKEPSKLVLGKKLLGQDCMLHYPLLFNDDEITLVVDKIFKEINEAFDSAV